MTWPFKKNQKDYYRICKKQGQYTIQRKLPTDGFWKELFFFPSLIKYEWYSAKDTLEKYVWVSDSLSGARKKVEELIPEYFSVEPQRCYYY